MEGARLKNCSHGNAARRFDCPTFRRALETGQTNRRNREPIRSRTQRAFLKSRDSTGVRPVANGSSRPLKS